MLNKSMVFVIKIIKDIGELSFQHNKFHGFINFSTYCSNKITRVRKCLKYTHNHKCAPKIKNPKFQLRPITADVVDNVRFVHSSILRQYLSFISALASLKFLFLKLNELGLMLCNSNTKVMMMKFLAKSFTK